MRAFIIRPFGTQREIDFDAVERDLIDPALAALGIEGRTTIEILRQGNIRVDMFQRLLTADLVVADLSIHNANVFYELGVRHALRNKYTFLLRANIDKYPFDLQTDRYFIYEKELPAASRTALIAALRHTLASDAPNSPVFQLLPDLKEQEHSCFCAAPRGFLETVGQAEAEKRVGDLAFLAAEIQGLEWEREGLRVIGRAQFRLKAFAEARTTWEAVRACNSLDLEANTLLVTISQRLGDLVRSDQAVQRVLDVNTATREQRAEVCALRGRNAKARWQAAWEKAPADQRRQEALRSPFLEDSFAAYMDAFNEDLNHFYSGLNALALLTVQTELARALPEVWAERFDSDEDSQQELKHRQERRGKLTATVELSLKAAKTRLDREEKKDSWLNISEADFVFLTSTRSPRIATAYRDALAGAPDFALDAARKQILLYQQLDILQNNVASALSVMSAVATVSSSAEPNAAKLPQRVLLFTGHMVDAPGRETPRFPANKEVIARQKIKEAILEELQFSEGLAHGIAGGASGGDILFHEVCAELGIPTKLYLALPKEQFIAASVAPAGPQWVERFNQLRKKLPPRQLADSEDLPAWLQDKPHYTIWQRNNLWMLYNALTDSKDNMTLIALWDGKAGDGPGGTEDLVRQANARGAKVILLKTKEIFGL